MKKVIFRVLWIVVVLYVLKVAVWVWIIDQRENCHANWYQWDEYTYTCTQSSANTIQSGSTENMNKSETTGSVATGN